MSADNEPRYGKDGTLTLQELRFAAQEAQGNREDPAGSFRRAFDPAGEIPEQEMIDRVAELLAREDIQTEIYIQQRVRDVADTLSLASSQMHKGHTGQAHLSITVARAGLLGAVNPPDDAEIAEAMAGSEAVIDWLDAQQDGAVH